MKKISFFIMAIICLFMASGPADAQLIIRNNGHAEVGVNPFEPLPDSLSQYNPSSFWWNVYDILCKCFNFAKSIKL